MTTKENKYKTKKIQEIYDLQRKIQEDKIVEQDESITSIIIKRDNVHVIHASHLTLIQELRLLHELTKLQNKLWDIVEKKMETTRTEMKGLSK